MATRPRLVQEGSPIIEEGNSDFQHSFAATKTWSNGSHDTARLGSNLIAMANVANQNKSSKPYKLQTRLVVGGESNEDDDPDMMMDEDDQGYDPDNQNGSSNDVAVGHATSHYYGAHGHVFHGRHEHQFATVYNDQISAPTDPIRHAPMNPSASIYRMPSPSTSPLVVLDAANIAYNYAKCLNPSQQSQRRQPDPRGIHLAIEYFSKRHCRVQAVVPISWYQLKPRPADHYHLQNRSCGDSDAKMITEDVEELRSLHQKGFLVACPPGDDDDAYALALARRGDHPLEQNNGIQQDEMMGMTDDTSRHLPTLLLGGYVVSNDFFQDAICRDEKKNGHSCHPLNITPISLRSWLKKKRISYSFANVGTVSEGEIQLVFLPNPRNHLIEAIDACNRLNCMV